MAFRQLESRFPNPNAKNGSKPRKPSVDVPVKIIFSDSETVEDSRLLH